MTPREQRLIARLKERVKDPERASDEGVVKVRPPAGAQAVDAAERELGFRLPELLRTIYTQVGNGGFGPAYGFLGVKGGATDERRNTLAGVYRSQRGLAQEHSHWRWPDGLLPLCRLGCGMYSCLDCAQPRVPVMIFDPNNLDADETDQKEAVLRWTNSFWHQDNGFVSWLEGWLDERPEREPTWPSAAWLRQRLWPGQPANVRTFLEALKAARGGE